MKSGKHLKIKKVLILVYISFLGLLLFFAVVEVVFRINSKYKISGITYDKKLGWKYKKAYTIKEMERNYICTFNNHGFRDREHSFLKNDDTKRIIFLGDSYTASLNVSDEEVFTRIFEKMINKDSNVAYDVMNVAVSGWATDQQFIYLEEEGIKYNPDYVILIIAPNDIRETYGKMFLYPDDDKLLKKSRIPLISLKARFYWYLANHFFVYQYLQKKFKTYHGSFKGIFRHFPVNFPVGKRLSTDYHLFLKEVPREVKAACYLFKLILLEMNQLCVKNNCRLILTVLPTKMEFVSPIKNKMFQPGKISEYVKNIAVENNIPFLDLFSLLKRENNPLNIFITEEHHLNQTGHNFIAEKIYQFFKFHKREFKHEVFGSTALMAAAYNNSTDVAKLLIEKGTDVNAKDNNGSTALMYAAMKNSLDVARLLIEKGTDVNAKAIKNWTALMVAESEDYSEMITLLKRHDAK